MNNADSFARLKAAVDYTIPRDKNGKVHVSVLDIDAALAEINAWRTALSQVMPLEYREWHDSGPSEWPSVTARTLLDLRKQVSDLLKEIEMQRVAMQAALKALDGWCDQPEDPQTYDECMERAMQAIKLLRSRLCALRSSNE